MKMNKALIHHLQISSTFARGCIDLRCSSQVSNNQERQNGERKMRGGRADTPSELQSVGLTQQRALRSVKCQILNNSRWLLIETNFNFRRKEQFKHMLRWLERQAVLLLWKLSWHWVHASLRKRETFSKPNRMLKYKSQLVEKVWHRKWHVFMLLAFWCSTGNRCTRKTHKVFLNKVNSVLQLLQIFFLFRKHWRKGHFFFKCHNIVAFLWKLLMSSHSIAASGYLSVEIWTCKNCTGQVVAGGNA